MKKILFILLSSVFIAGYSQTFTKINGALQLKGKQLCNKDGKPVQLKGFSTYNITYCPECVTYEALKSNRDFWGVNVIRATVYVSESWNKRNYNNDPAFSKALVDSIIKWTEQLGLYCIIDWHVLTPGNPNDKVYSGVDAFFQELSSKYAHKSHVIYEICNEPNGETVTWDTIANYANRIIPVIRKNSPQAIIIVGTPRWSQMLDKVNPSLLNDTKNIMYAFHFYAASHANLYSMFIEEIHRIPVFNTEWGPCEYTGNGHVDFNSSEKFLDAMNMHIQNEDTVKISWCNFSYSDIKETASALKPKSCEKGFWNNLSPTGLFVKEHLLKQ